MNKKVSVLLIGCGNMGASHAFAYHKHNGFEICGLVSRGKSKDDLNVALKSNYKVFTDYKSAIISTDPDAVCISTFYVCPMHAAALPCQIEPGKQWKLMAQIHSLHTTTKLLSIKRRFLE